MKKLVLGVVALGVMVNVALAYDMCGVERERYVKCLKYHSGGQGDTSNGCWGEYGRWTSLEQLKTQFEICQIEYGRYSN